MHVDGFRFDLAATLARELHEVDRLGAFLDIIHQDPILSQVKLIAEPWDLGEGGYQVGKFPVGWAEWNDKYRDAVRSYWKGDGGIIGELAYRITGSSDLYARSGRRPYASINFVTAHDGFTLEDLVSYNSKHNEANGEENRDGTDNNRSWNCGVEGPTDDPEIKRLRAQQKRNFLATLCLSQGVPMLLAGDAVGHTQGGNNNAYCQDNEISWLDWSHEKVDHELLAFAQRVIAVRKDHPVFRRRNFFQGRQIRGVGRRRSLPDRLLPRLPLGGVERQVPRLRASLLEGRSGTRGRDGVPPRGIRRHLLVERPRRVREHQLHHGARRLYTARSRELRAEAQRGER